MAEPIEPNRRWLVAAWPGMGNVAVIAAGYLIQKLGMQPVAELEAKGHFDLQQVEVSKGVIEKPRLPRSLLFRTPAAQSPATPAEASGGTAPVRRTPDLTVFIGEAQPSVGSYPFAHQLLERVKEYGVDRVITFASMASQLHPSHQPRVYGAATDAAMLDELRRLEVRPVEEGQIGGMNGLLLGACAERDVPGMCLLGEIPFFAAGVPNPGAAKAVLDAFSLMARIDLDLEELAKHAEKIEQALLKMMENMERQARSGEGEEPGGSEFRPGPESAPEPTDAGPDAATKAKIERLFAEARKDRSKSIVLKKELDRLGLFKQYENRFLDLFKRAE